MERMERIAPTRFGLYETIQAALQNSANLVEIDFISQAYQLHASNGQWEFILFSMPIQTKVDQQMWHGVALSAKAEPTDVTIYWGLENGTVGLTGADYDVRLDPNNLRHREEVEKINYAINTAWYGQDISF